MNSTFVKNKDEVQVPLVRSLRGREPRPYRRECVSRPPRVRCNQYVGCPVQQVYSNRQDWLMRQVGAVS
jgi:hypothetical protein